MRELLRQVGDLLGGRARRQAYAVFGLILVMAIVEALGVASIMPFIAVLSNPSVVESNPYLAMAYERLGFASVQKFILFLGLATFVLLMGSIAVRALTLWAHLRFMNLQIHAVGSRLVRHYLMQPYEWFLSRRSSDIGVNVLSEVTNVIQGVVYQFMVFASNVIVALLLFLLLISVDPVLAVLVTLVLGGAYAGVFLLVNRRLSRVGHGRVVENRERFKIVQEAFGGIKDVKVNGLEQRFLRRFIGPSRRMAKLSVSGAIIAELPAFALQAIVFGGMLLVLMYLVWTHGTFQGALPYIALYALAGYRLMPALQGAYRNISQLRFHMPALAALHSDIRTLGLSDEVSDAPFAESVAPLGLKHQLELRRVTYRYAGAEQAALDDVSLTIDAYTTVALVGPTGSGKTTIVDVMLGLLKPQSGAVIVDGTEISHESLRGWQRTVGYVPQTIFLADDTVTGNIAFGVPEDEVDRVAVERAARIAKLDEFVSRDLPAGYDTMIGERGVRMSGGQRQRIGIARAMYHDPELLIFDEATSALDNVTEHALMEAVHELGKQKTIILIAHRLSTVRSCDRIFLLERGKIVASGSYDELLESSDGFRKLAKAGLSGSV